MEEISSISILGVINMKCVSRLTDRKPFLDFSSKLFLRVITSPECPVKTNPPRVSSILIERLSPISSVLRNELIEVAIFFVLQWDASPNGADVLIP